jgi:PAS domain S-box-containing protein
MKEAIRGSMLRPLLSALIPLIAFGVQWTFWAAFKPFVWFLFYPAVFFSSWVGGFSGGLLSTFISTAIVWWFFITPENSFRLENPMSLVSIGVFMGMGVLFSISHGRLRKANRLASEALESARRANEQLSEANEKVTRLYEKSREMDELKSQFFANVSHELRTPLALILGPVSRRLAEADLNERDRRELEVVERNARLLYRHVTDLLDVAKLEAGRMVMRYSRVDLSAMVRFMASHFNILADEKGIAFNLTAPDALPAQVDGEKCRRILLNLISNAFKFTPDGGEIALDLIAEGGRAVIRLRDNGPGVPVPLREAVFEPFRQAEGGVDRRYGGTGLGLAIVREFVELHGGSVAVGDTPGGGAAFTVCLPLTAPAGIEILPMPAVADEELHGQAVDELRPRADSSMEPESFPQRDAPLILVVEDNPDMNAFTTGALGSLYRVAAAFDGEEGFAKAVSLIPDLILSDVMMPGMGGEQLLAKLRGRPETSRIPVVILTAKADEELRVKLLREGAQDYLSKPFSVEELLARVGGLIAERRRSAGELNRSESLRQTTVAALSEGVVLFDASGRVITCNPSAERILGLTEAEMGDIGNWQGGRRFVREDGSPFPAEELPVVKTVADGAARHGVVLGLIRREEKPLWLLVNCEPVRDAVTDDLSSVVLSFTDITGRKEAEEEVLRLNTELERRVDERTAELFAANQELESFAYAVSHDLRAPLRAMSGFSNALVEDLGDRLDGEARIYLDEIVVASRQMGRLIDGILTLSRSTRGELRRDPVDISAMAGAIVEELERMEPERKVEWSIEEGLTTRGDSRMIEVVLRNLLGNAWKYTAGSDRPEIGLYAEREGSETFICVTDNGAGFDMAHGEKLFQPFQRLHRQDEFPGLGIGLATAQRIVHRHGGMIQGVSAPGKGATFRFSLP